MQFRMQHYDMIIIKSKKEKREFFVFLTATYCTAHIRNIIHILSLGAPSMSVVK